MNNSPQKMTRTLEGTVVSNARDKTIAVLVERRTVHPLYKKVIRKSNKVHAHDAFNACLIGDVVIVVECPRYSKSKAFNLVRIMRKGQEVDIAKSAPDLTIDTVK